MKAWIVREDQEGFATIVFNNHGLAARKEGASELDLDFDQVECNRAKEFDKYNNKTLDVEILIKDHGWWFECYHCYKKIEKDMDNFDAVLFCTSSYFCSQECLIKYRKARDAKNRK